MKEKNKEPIKKLNMKLKSDESKSSEETKQDSTPIPNLMRVEQYLKKKYDFRFNIITGRNEFKLLGEKEFTYLDDFKINSLLRELTKNHIRTNVTSLRGLLLSDFCPVYNPFMSYFKSLPRWDEKTDYINLLAQTVKTTNDAHWSKCFKKWIVAMVGCAISEAVVNHCVIVFVGKQGIGKTTWMLNLMPSQLNNHCYSGTINPNNKDTLIHLSECLLINLDELETLNKSEIGSLKELITKDYIRVRRPYGYYNESIPRRASFAGSVNTKEFLNDSTGSRRFLCFEVNEIDYENKIDIDKFYSQALHLYESGFKFWFDKEDGNEVAAQNDQFNMITMEEELLLKHFSIANFEEAEALLTTTGIITELSKRSKLTVTDSNLLRIGRCLRKHQFERKKHKGVYVYAIKRIKQK